MRRPYSWVRPVVLAAVVFAAPEAAAQDKRLTWPSVRVEARLDADGRLHVTERQVIRFVGDWNGGERSFAQRFGQQITLTALRRIEPATGAATLLDEGDLSRVDQFKWTDSHTLRWRSRLPEDPPFAGDERTYELDLVYDNVLQRRDEGWLLDHDFAFADRAEPIDTFSVALTLDPVWQRTGDGAQQWSAIALPPGEGLVVTVPLTRADGSVPAGVYVGAPAEARWGLVAVLWGGLAFYLVGWARRERASTRWEVEALPPVTPDWLRHNVFSMAPEVAGAAWDNTTSAPEVAAVIARLVAAGSLASTVREEKVLFIKRQVLQLSLPKGRGVFRDYEKALIDALFEPGATTTDTDRVRERYRKSGFDPASLISFGVSTTVSRMAPELPGDPPGQWKVPLAMMTVAVALVAYGISRRTWDAPLLGLGLLPLLVTMIFGISAASAYRTEVFRLRLWLVVLLAFLVLPAGLMTWFLLFPPAAFGAFTQAGIVVAWLVLARSTLQYAAPVHSPERVRLRRRLGHAREWFKAQLATPAPALEDAWYPWLIAFGLGSAVDQWFRAFGGAAAAAGVARMGSSGGSSGSSSTGGSGWTGFGGGGGFAGGGSSASFAAAVGGMAASVPKPGSSSSGGGGGGGSSGGGGGGGW